MTNIGYGISEFKGGMKAGVLYKIMIYDFAGDKNHDFTVTLYSDMSEVKLTDASILDDLEI
jgi:hypothetical protein